jgi:signal transduction histidine kinase
LSLPSIIGEILCITNQYHHLFFTNDKRLTAGIAGLSLAIIMAIYSFIGLSYIFQYAANQTNIIKKRSAYFLILSDLIPFVFEVLYIVDVSFISNSLRLRFFPCFSLSITSVIIAFIIFKYRFLDLIPIVQKDIVNNLNEAIIIVGNEGKVVNYNNSFLKNFPIYERNKTDMDFRVFIEYLKEETNNQTDSLFDSLVNPEEREYSTELILKTEHCFLITVKPIFAFTNEFIGRIITLTDITEYKKLKEAKGELDVIKERSRIAQDVHDTLGHKMTLLLYLLEIISINSKENPIIQTDLQKAIKVANEGYEELRNSIYGLTFKELQMNNLIKILNELFAEFTFSGMEVDFSIDGKTEHYDQTYSPIIYRICQEALTNSFKHGKAQKVSIILQFIEEKIKLFIFDNGKGCETIKKGVGLLSMEQRVKRLNGNLVLGSSDDGFYINVELPIEYEGRVKCV